VGVGVGELPVDRYTHLRTQLARKLQVQPELTGCEPCSAARIGRPVLFTPTGLLAQPSEQQDSDCSHPWDIRGHNANHRPVHSLATMTLEPLLPI
jgi:hypothetical protein